MAMLRIEGVKGEFGDRSNSSIYQRVRDGLMTAPVPIGQRSVGWPDHECKKIGAARIAGQTPDQIRDLVKQLHEQRVEDFKRLMGTAHTGGDDGRPQQRGS